MATTCSISAERSYVVQNRRFSVKQFTDIPMLLSQLRAEKFTGKVTIDLGQGGINSVSAERQQNLVVDKPNVTA